MSENTPVKRRRSASSKITLNLSAQTRAVLAKKHTASGSDEKFTDWAAGYAAQVLEDHLEEEEAETIAEVVAEQQATYVTTLDGIPLNVISNYMANTARED